MRSLLAWLGDVILGPRCAHRCGERVFPKDRTSHEETEHAGDRL